MSSDSKLLIGETVITNPPTRASAMMDILLATIGGKERTLDAFSALAARAGLKITDVFKAPQGDFSIMECVKA